MGSMNVCKVSEQYVQTKNVKLAHRRKSKEINKVIRIHHQFHSDPSGS